MPIITIDKVPLSLDVKAYLYASGLKGLKPVGDNIMACCPFHNESKPSFGVHADNGVYNCLGCGAHGSFAALVMHLEHFDTVWDAEQHLLRKYGKYAVNVDEPLSLNFNDVMAAQFLDESILVGLRFRHPYLESRGITDLWQRRFEIGYDHASKAITIPWRDASGRLVLIKYRSVLNKRFWYEGKHKSSHLYGMHHVRRRGDKVVCICESETDCIYLWQCGHPAVALGGSDISAAQSRILINSAVDEFVCFTDNDEAGMKAQTAIVRALAGHKRVTGVPWQMLNEQLKDANECSVGQIEALVDNRTSICLSLDFR